MAFYSNKDLEIQLGLTRQTCYDLVAHRRIPFFPYVKVRKKGARNDMTPQFPFSLYREQSVSQLIYLLNKMDGDTNEKRAKNLMAWADDNYTSIKKEEMDMFFSQNSMSELGRKMDAILEKLGAEVPAPLTPDAPAEQAAEAPEAPKGWTDRDDWRVLAERNVGASTPIKNSVIKALHPIIIGLPNFSVFGSRGFKKANVIDLVHAVHPVLSNRMRKHKDVVWEHTRKFLLQHNYVAQGPTADTLVLGSWLQPPEAQNAESQQQSAQ